MFVQWSDAWATGLAEVDEHHKLLVERLNSLYASAQGGQGDGRFVTELQSLVEETRTHFHDEERLMEACAYPWLSTHREQHDDFLTVVAGLYQAISAAGPDFKVAASRSLDFIRDWMIIHIRDHDRWLHHHLSGAAAAPRGAESLRGV